MIKDKNLLILRDRIIAYLKESRDITSEEEKRISDDCLSKPKRAAIYVDFFRKNLSSNIKGSRILDFGSGDGIYAIEFSKRGADVVGIDIDSFLIEITKEFTKRIDVNTQFVNYLNKSIPFEDNYFDYSYCLQTFEHLDDPINSLRELYRVLKKGGILHISFPNRFYPYDSHAQLAIIPWLPYKTADFLTKFCKKHSLKYYSNLHFYSYQKFKKILDRSRTDFSIVMRNDNAPFIKKIFIDLMHRFNIHHTVLTQNISVFLEKH